MLPASGLRRLAKSRMYRVESGKSRVQEIGVERDNDVGVFQPVLRFHRLTESHLRALEHIVAIHRLIHMPLRLRIKLEHGLQLIGKRR